MKPVEINPINTSYDYKKYKRIVVIISVILPALMGPPLLLAAGHPQMEFLISFCLWIGNTTLMVVWCYWDSLQRHQRLPKFFRLASVLLGVIALYYYLVKSRGMKKGAVAILQATALVIGTFLLAVVMAAIFSEIFDIPIPE